MPETALCFYCKEAIKFFPLNGWRHVKTDMAICDTVAKPIIQNKDDRMDVTTSPYARFFDENSSEWRREAEYNVMFVRGVQAFANAHLIARGHLFLNEIYDDLGLDRTSVGAIVGWTRTGDGDGHIDFGLENDHNVKFLAGFESVVILDFNVDGVIYDKI